MEIVHIALSGEYEDYEALVLQRDGLEREAQAWYDAYIREFGEEVTEAFSLKVECIALKKELTMYVHARNAGLTPDPEVIAEQLARQMSAYRIELQSMLMRQNSVLAAVPISDYEVRQIKTLYRKLAKLLHPDISPLMEQIPVLKPLFQRVLNAYRCNDLEALQELEVIINRTLTENGVEGYEMTIPNLPERIAALEEEIARIVSTEPYTYGELLADRDAVTEKHEGLQREIAQYEEYKKQLEAALKNVKEGREP